ncbi:MAG: hypothetical protein KDD58_03415 [Bdellovibrionales bacterium]|nr:hypothetical protein [Bdellovibrionales bacterium]
MIKNFLYFIFLLIFCHVASASKKIQVAFLEFYNNGEIVSLEPGGRFGHVAISYKNGWIHSFPPYEVGFTTDLERFGKLAEIIELDAPAAFSEEELINSIGKPTTLISEWHDNDTTYCSKFVGQIIGIPPMRNNWKAPIWQQFPPEEYIEWGLSPDDIYNYLLELKNIKRFRFNSNSQCHKVLN